jgi:hypothetical protein
MDIPFRSVAFTLLVGFALTMGKASAQQVSTAPIRMEKGLPYVTCSIGSSAPLNCLLDTGSAMTGVRRGLVKQLKLSTHTDPTIPRQDIAAQALDGLDLRVGSTTWSAKRTSVAPADLELLDKEAGPGFHTDVVIGTELLEQYQVTLDPDASEVRFSRPGTAPPTSADKLMTSVFGIPFAPLGIKTADGHAAVGLFSLDTGSRPALMLSDPYWSKQPLLASEGAAEVETEKLTLSAIRIGHTTMHRVVATRPAKGSGLLGSEKLAGVIGGPVLNHFVVIYDLPNKAVWMTPTRKDPPR